MGRDRLPTLSGGLAVGEKASANGKKVQVSRDLGLPAEGCAVAAR
jgi:hypothetical protein